MGATFLWLSLPIPPAYVADLSARFNEAVTASPVSPTARWVLERWREAPHSLIPEFVPDPTRPGALTDAEGAEEFEELFRPEALSEFGQGIIRLGGEAEAWDFEFTEQNVVVTDRIPASAALYFGLGEERAARIPGHFGALFVTPGEVGQVLSRVEGLFEKPTLEMRMRARRWLDRGNNDFTHPEELFAFIPRALRTSHARHEGLLLLTARG
ncbi:hypothetical protein [Melittangium boletus]|uniref:hypothetical protein n=1 Tax=Melittangium boletus TaxID=83453 RepID=UPI003DA311B6